MVRSGAVTLLPSGDVEVQSQSRDELTYTVHGSCPCPDAQHRAPNDHCTHLLAAWLVRRVHSALPPASPAPSSAEPAAPALPEAPASVNCPIMIEGRQVQVTLRDTDETQLLGRLAALLRQYPLTETQHRPRATTPFRQAGVRSTACRCARTTKQVGPGTPTKLLTVGAQAASDNLRAEDTLCP
jgi:hypothetical protein